jgi:hypothetical protein
VSFMLPSAVSFDYRVISYGKPMAGRIVEDGLG